MRQLLLVLATAAVLLTATGGATAARPADLVIAADSHGTVTRFGALTPGAIPTGQTGYGAAKVAFGPPTTVVRPERNFCKARWAGIRMEIWFNDLSGATACREGGYLWLARVRSTRWRTRDGLRVGDAAARIRRLHPRAERHGRDWWLARSFTQLGDGGWYGTVVAVVRGGRVTGFDVAFNAGE